MAPVARGFRFGQDLRTRKNHSRARWQRLAGGYVFRPALAGAPRYLVSQLIEDVSPHVMGALQVFQIVMRLLRPAMLVSSDRVGEGCGAQRVPG